MTQLGVAIPVYNAQNSITEVVEGVLARFARMNISGRVVLVDDGSTDRSFSVLRQLAAEHDNVLAVRLVRNFGQQNALLCGLSFLSDCDFCATMDDDLQHPNELLESLWVKIQLGCDLVYAVPQGEQRPFFRRLGSLGRDILFSLCTQKPQGIRVSSLRMMSGALVGKILAERQSYVYLSASAFRYRPKTTCLFYTPRPRAFGTSGYNLRRLAVVYWRLFCYYTPLGGLFRPRGFSAPYEIAEIVEGGPLLEQTNDSRRFELSEKRPIGRETAGARDCTGRLLRKPAGRRAG